MCLFMCYISIESTNKIIVPNKFDDIYIIIVILYRILDYKFSSILKEKYKLKFVLK